MKVLPIIILLFIILPYPSQAQELRFEHLSMSEGLSQSVVLCILQDSKGLMWFGTEDGLNRYDGYQFTVYQHEPENPNSLSSSHILSLQEDGEGILWVGTSNGLNRFDTVHHTVKRYLHNDHDLTSLSHNEVYATYQDRQGTLWLGTMDGLNRFDPRTDTFVRYQHQDSDPTSLSNSQINSNRAIYEDRQGHLWIGTGNGLNKFDRQTNTFTYFLHQADNPHSLSDGEIYSLHEDKTGLLWIAGTQGLDKFDLTTQRATHYFSGEIIFDIYQDKDGLLWLATDGSGAYRFDPQTEHYEKYYYDSRKPMSLSNDFINIFYEDRSGTMWIGTWGGGINRLDPALKPFGLYFYQPYNTQGLNIPTVTTIYEDHDGKTIWIGTEGGGLNRFDRETNTFTHYLHDDENPNSLLHNAVYAITQDEQGNLWLGTWGGLSYFDPINKTFTNYLAEEDNPSSLSSNEVYSLIQDRQGNLWIGTWYQALSKFDPKTQTFTHYPQEKLGDISIYALYEDRQGTIWVGTRSNGLHRFNAETDSFIRYVHDDQDSSTLSNNYISALYEDSQERFWVGTSGGGLNLMDRATGKFRTYRRSDGLPSDVIYRVVEDPQGYLWLATFNGLSRFDPKTQQFRNYTPEDGLQGKEFLSGIALRSGELMFGGRNGYNLFRPEAIKDNPFVPPIVFTDFKLFNQSVTLGKQLSKNIVFTEEIILSHQDTVFSFEFSALNYLSPRQNRYRYRMEGFDKNWIEVNSHQRSITYTNLDPGHYTFRVKGSNNDGIWNETGAAIKLTLLPPWWQTGWAYLIYFVVIVGSVIMLFTAQQRKLARTRAINERLRHVDKLKDEFLANTSHELRTPLNGIIGLAESLIEGVTGNLPDSTKANLAMIVASGKRLANLVNDILDFSKLKHNTIELQLKPVGLREIVEIVLVLSRPLVATKSLKLINHVSADLPPVYADESRLQQILHNLIGNAIKFTEQGQIEIAAQINQSIVQVTVTDTGIGIPQDRQARIFESFEQADGSIAREYGGTGLGLAVTKQLVELHRGHLWVRSQEGQGSQFIFTLPLATGEKLSTSQKLLTSQSSIQVAEKLADFQATPTEIETQPLIEMGKCFCVLIVDDEPVNLQVLNNFLSLQKIYRIVQATSGLEAIRLIDEGLKPDIVVLDVMMPKMTGYEVTQKLREKWALNELPILLLTAKNQVADLITGLEAGANDYLTKPISKDELLARIRVHLNVKQLQEENLRMQAELDVSRHLQQVLLPRERELSQISHLEVAGFMEPATVVGGDYYDVLIHRDGVKVGIGDVTGHGLESGILAMMVQTAVRTLLTHGETNAVKFLATINRTIYDNVQRMGIDRNLSLCLLDWQNHRLRVSGQHEEVLIVRQGEIECLETTDLGFPVGLEPDIADFVAERQFELLSGDVVVLYSDGVTEAENEWGDLYSLERLCTVVSQCWQLKASEIKRRIIDDVHQFIGRGGLLDDVTVVVLKQL